MRITYEVTCGNRLTYQGIKTLNSSHWKLNERYPGQSEAGERWKAKKHDWRDYLRWGDVGINTALTI